LACGSFRCVVLVWRYAIKLPRPRAWRAGMCSNRWEREMWQHWRPIFDEWEGRLCPVLFADRRGLVVVMRRAKQPVNVADAHEWLMAIPWPNTTGEPSLENAGWLNGRLVEVDYGLSDQELVEQRRAYYEDHQGDARSPRPAVGMLGATAGHHGRRSEGRSRP
jgi:hypothetical protein